MREQEYFDKLAEDRMASAKVLNKHSMKGVKKSVIDKYSDQAHFIYELLQNADDVHATYTKFILNKDELVFVHNGTRHFSVTDPDKEGSDEKIGDINAITSIGQSTKEGDHFTIGKFGVGFKAVFQYTNSPHIFDDDFRFKIVDFIVPQRIENDHPMREPHETLFVFPFDTADSDKETSFNSVKDKLKNLVYPTLFLKNIKEISMDLGEGDCLMYSMDEQILVNGRLKSSLVKIVFGSKQAYFLKFTKPVDEFEVSICYYIDYEGRFCEIVQPAFCFFPTKETTGLHFLIHAPFVLTDSREGIKQGDQHNIRMINILSDVVVSSISMMREMTNPISGGRMLDETIYHVIPLSPTNLNKNLPFNDFYDEILVLFRDECVIPTETSYIRGRDAYWATNPEPMSLFSTESLRELTCNQNADWLSKDKHMALGFQLFLENITAHRLEDKDVLTFLENEYIISSESGRESFIEKQSSTWIMDFYAWLNKSKTRTQVASKIPLFID